MTRVLLPPTSREVPFVGTEVDMNTASTTNPFTAQAVTYACLNFAQMGSFSICGEQCSIVRPSGLHRRSGNTSAEKYDEHKESKNVGHIWW